MSQNDLEPSLLVRYLADESSGEEKREVEEWINASSENSRKFKDLQQIWITSGNQQEFKKKAFDANSDWNRLRSKIEQTEAGNRNSSHRKTKVGHTASRHRLWPALARVAAVLIITGLLGLFAYQNWSPADEQVSEPALREITTAMAQRVNLTLSDGTDVLLNAGSTLRLPENFVADKREVFLNGQAYFDVESDPERPFIIHSDGATTRVLGTSFSVRAYPDEDTITIAVKEGKVSFEAENAEGNHQVELMKNELGRLDRMSRSLHMQSVDDMALHFGWVDGYLKFKETPLEKVAVELERRYGVAVNFEGQDLKRLSLTALLKSRSIKNVLDVISTSLNIDYTLTENEVIFLNK